LLGRSEVRSNARAGTAALEPLLRGFRPLFLSGGEKPMQDIFYIVITIIFFVLAAAFTYGCERLEKEEK
jgi:hypothetical protein